MGAANTSMDGYPAYPGNYPGAGPQPDYGAAGQMPRPPSQSNAQSPHPGKCRVSAFLVPWRLAFIIQIIHCFIF